MRSQPLQLTLRHPDSASTLVLGRSLSSASDSSKSFVTDAGDILKDQIEHLMAEYKRATGETFQARIGTLNYNYSPIIRCAS